MRRIDEAAAIAGNAGGIGNDQFCFAAGDFEIAAQLTRITAVNLIENHPRAAGSHVGVGRNPATQFSERGVATVVQDRAAGVDIKLLEAVARHACRCGCCDVDLR